ncbi:hypothetical protein KPH14_008620 [Odynerus spinipes]|uniref:Cytochrome P450 n=1 Tax=Odynerus spinipes TaxID=1348599 RepID=A0AAD9VSF5_9HYME|nr:hypothetical protein KPH14_008620 [Odynerus spinipes]
MEAVPIASSFLPSMGFYPLILLAVILAATYFYIETSRLMRYGKKLPGPPLVPIFGNALLTLNVHTKDVLKTLLKLDVYGNVTRAFLGTKLFVFLVEPRDIEIILSSHVHINKSPEYRFFKPWLGDGLLISTGEKWYNHRKIIAPTFHMSVLKTFVPLFYENSIDLVKRLREKIGQEFDCHDYLSAVTVDILMETAMGVRGTQKDKCSFDYAMAVMKMCNIIHQRQYKFLLRFDTYFQFTSFAKQQKQLLNTIHSLTTQVIRRKKGESLNKEIVDFVEKTQEKEGNKNETKKEENYTNLHYVKDDLDEIDENDVGEKRRLAFLDLMLELRKSGAKLTDEEIKEEVDTIMFEGHDTTAAGSSFVLCLLGTHQNIQQRVIEELNEIFKGTDRPCTFADTLEMKYLERVILESLRLFPPVPAIARTLSEDVQLVTNNYVLPKGCTVIIPPYKVHRLPEYYPDPEKFDPDNFLPERMQERHYYSFVPFSAGPRSCVGRKYALLKLKVLLSTILRNYKIFSDIKEEDYQLQIDIILKRTDGFRIKIAPREKFVQEVRA